MAPPDVSVVVVNWNTEDLLRECLLSVRAHLGSACETIVVDNASVDGSAEMVAGEFPEVHLIRNSENLGFGRGNNIGMARPPAASSSSSTATRAWRTGGSWGSSAASRSGRAWACWGHASVIPTAGRSRARSASRPSTAWPWRSSGSTS